MAAVVAITLHHHTHHHDYQLGDARRKRLEVNARKVLRTPRTPRENTRTSAHKPHTAMPRAQNRCHAMFVAFFERSTVVSRTCNQQKDTKLTLFLRVEFLLASLCFRSGICGTTALSANTKKFTVTASTVGFGFRTQGPGVRAPGSEIPPKGHFFLKFGVLVKSSRGAYSKDLAA